jgi:hypothetical protein
MTRGTWYCSNLPGLVVVLAVALSACSPSARTPDSFATSDSAGVAIADNREPEWRLGGAWTLATRPDLSIGEAEGDSTQQLYQVAAAARIAPDTIVVVNAGTAEVRWYDGTGRFIRSVGRQGGGPGEFSRFGPGTLCTTSDSQILVSDPGQQRANVFTRAGEFVAVVQLAADAAFPSIQGCFADGSLLAWRSVGSTDRIPGTIIQSQFVWSRISAEGERLADLVELPSSPQYLLDQGDGTATYHTIPFTTRPTAAAGSDHVYAAPGGPALIERRTLTGTLDQLIRWEPETRVQSADVYDRYRDHTIDAQSSPQRRSHWSRFFELGLDTPDEVAAISALKVDDAAYVWAERYRLPWDSTATWDVFAPNGRWLGGVAMPREFRPLHLGSDFILGASRDPLGVERIDSYRLQRQGSGR